jgi:transposase-like protein
MNVILEEPCERWAERLMEHVESGDLRRTVRLQRLLGEMARQPGQSLPQQCKGTASLKGAYRLLQGGCVQADAIVKSAARAMVQGLSSQAGAEVVLAVQDTTTLNFSGHEAMEGRGPIGNGNSGKTQGFFLHSTVSLGPQGRLYGLLDAEVYARDEAALKARKKGERNRQSSAQKESHRWVRSVQSSARLCVLLPQAEAVVNVADREADMYELFLEAQRLHREHGGRFHVLVRAQHDRRLDGTEQRLWEHLSEQSAQVCWEVELPAAKGIHGKQARRVEAFWQTVALKVPDHQRKHHGQGESLAVTLIVVREPQPPAGQPALEWVLLSTWPVGGPGELQRVVGWYVKRWQIEVLHRVLKTGCKVEERRLQQEHSAQAMIVLDLLVAIRIMGLVGASRHQPEAEAGACITPTEEAVLRARFESAKTGTSGRPLSLGQAMRWIAQMGGHPGMPSSPPPGAETLWRGLTRLHIMADAWLLFQATQKCG